MKNLQTLSQIPSSSLYIQLSLLATAPRMLISFSRLMWSCWFAWIRWNPLGDKILYHDSVLVIVSGFTSLIEDFVIRRYQVTKLFCVKWSFDNASSARGLSYFGRHRNFWSFGKWKNAVLPRFCHRCSESESWWMCAGACTSVASRLSVKSSNQNGRSANGSSASFLSSFKDSCPSLLLVRSSLHSDTESEDDLDAALFPETGVHLVPTIPVVAL